MDMNTKKTLADYMNEVEPYKKEEIWVDDCTDLRDVARALVTLGEKIDNGDFSESRKNALQKE